MYKRKDSYYLKAKQEGYRSRAAYKLQQIVSAEKIVKAGDLVVDAGAAPGGWSQLLLRMVGPKGKVAAVDILEMEPMGGENFRFWHRSLEEPALPAEVVGFLGRKADLVLSDAAPNTTGSAFTDQARSADLVRVIFGFAKETLRPGGSFLAKIFTGAESDLVFKELQPHFDKVRRIRPEATRKESFELYLIGKGFKTTEGTP
ncbi:MAG TPA: RlmE family RNA methyltransferase [Candidatus Deferrimicrobiaceae bacterium]